MPRILALTPALCRRATRIAARRVGFDLAAGNLPRTPHHRRPDTIAAEALRRACGLDSTDATTRALGICPGAVWRADRADHSGFEAAVRAVVASLTNQPHSRKARL